MPFWTKAAPSGCPFPQINASLGCAAEAYKKPNFIEFYEISRTDECVDMIPIPLSFGSCQVCARDAFGRMVASGLPYHVTQRGNRREPIFFEGLERRGQEPVKKWKDASRQGTIADVRAVYCSCNRVLPRSRSNGTKTAGARSFRQNSRNPASVAAAGTANGALFPPVGRYAAHAGPWALFLAAYLWLKV